MTNALAFEKTGAAKLLVGDENIRTRMQAALTQWHAPNAAAVIAENILKSSKLQHPSTKEIPSSNHQPNARANVFGAWFLMFLWMLALGAWCFFQP